MAKSKYAPALFEVIDGQQPRKKDSGRLALPGWWRSGKPDDRTDVQDATATPETREAAAPGEAEPASAAETAREPEAPPSPAVRPEESVARAPEAPSPAGDVPERPPWARVRSGRLEVSLNPVNAAVVGGVALLAMLCSYQVGARFGAPEPVASSTEGSEEAPNPDVLNPGSAGGAGQSAGDGRGQPTVGVPVPTSVQRSSGLQYVVIESFRPEHLEHAQHAQRWLAQFGKVPATLETANGWHLLISAEGFEFTQERERQWLDRVRALGQEYKRAFKGKRDILYDFHDPYARKW